MGESVYNAWMIEHAAHLTEHAFRTIAATPVLEQLHTHTHTHHIMSYYQQLCNRVIVSTHPSAKIKT